MSKIKVVKEKKTKRPKRGQSNVTSKTRKLPKFAITAVAAVVVAAVALIWALPNLPLRPSAHPQDGYKGVIELWNVESFEGGSGSRSSWLTGRSAKFEAKHSGLFVHVTTLTDAELTQKIADGQTFDIICFSRGSGDEVKEMLAPIDADTSAVRDNMLLAGQIGGKQYAVPLYAGAYCLFARQSQLVQDDLLSKALTQTYTRKIGKNTIELSPMVCGFTPYNSPLTALAMSGGKGNASSIAENVTQYQAYEKFVSNKSSVTLLGTQRDLFRLNQREENGKIEELGFYPLAGYTDLVQFVGVSSSCGEKFSACEEYISYLLSAEAQQTLVNLSLFSVLDTALYTDRRYSSLETGLAQAFVPNAFVDAEIIAGQRQTAKSTLAM